MVTAAGCRPAPAQPARLSGIALRIHQVAPPVGKPPEQNSWLGLVKPPALGLFCLMMPPAKTGKVAFTGSSALVVRDRVILIAARRRITASGEAAGAVADIDDVPQ